MKKNPTPAMSATQLRNTAEQFSTWALVHPMQGESDTRKLLHELQVHQIELEMQNAELRQAQTATEEALKKVTELNKRLKQSLNAASAPQKTAATESLALLSSDKK